MMSDFEVMFSFLKKWSAPSDNCLWDNMRSTGRVRARVRFLSNWCLSVYDAVSQTLWKNLQNTCSRLSNPSTMVSSVDIASVVDLLFLNPNSSGFRILKLWRKFRSPFRYAFLKTSLMIGRLKLVYSFCQMWIVFS